MSEGESSTPGETAAAPAAFTGKLPPVGHFFSESWHLYTAKVGKLFGILFLGLLIVLGIQLVIFALAATAVHFLADWKLLISVATVGIASLVMFYMIFRLHLAMVYAVAMDDLGVRASIAAAGPATLSFMWLGYLNVFLILGGFFFFLIPAIVFSVWFYFASYVFASESLRGWDALLRSKALVKGKWWGVVGRLILIGIVLMALSFIPILGFFISLFLIPFGTVYAYVLYRQLTEAYDPAAAPVSSKAPILIISLLGFLFPVLVLVFVIKNAPNISGKFQQAVQSMEKESGEASSEPEGEPFPAMNMVSAPTEPSMPTAESIFKPKYAGSHEVLLKNKQRLIGDIVERDTAGLWLETGPGERVYVMKNEIESVKDLKE